MDKMLIFEILQCDKTVFTHYNMLPHEDARHTPFCFFLFVKQGFTSIFPMIGLLFLYITDV